MTTSLLNRQGRLPTPTPWYGDMRRQKMKEWAATCYCGVICDTVVWQATNEGEVCLVSRYEKTKNQGLFKLLIPRYHIWCRGLSVGMSQNGKFQISLELDLLHANKFCTYRSIIPTHVEDVFGALENEKTEHQGDGTWRNYI